MLHWFHCWRLRRHALAAKRRAALREQRRRNMIYSMFMRSVAVHIEDAGGASPREWR